MPEEVIFESETVESRVTIAEYLRTVASNLESGAPIALSAAGQETSLSPPETLTFEVKAERETGGGSPELSVEFELEWSEGQAGGSAEGLNIE